MSWFERDENCQLSPFQTSNQLTNSEENTKFLFQGRFQVDKGLNVVNSSKLVLKDNNRSSSGFPNNQKSENLKWIISQMKVGQLRTINLSPQRIPRKILMTNFIKPESPIKSKIKIKELTIPGFKEDRVKYQCSPLKKESKYDESENIKSFYKMYHKKSNKLPEMSNNINLDAGTSLWQQSNKIKKRRATSNYNDMIKKAYIEKQRHDEKESLVEEELLKFSRLNFKLGTKSIISNGSSNNIHIETQQKTETNLRGQEQTEGPTMQKSLPPVPERKQTRNENEYNIQELREDCELLKPTKIFSENLSSKTFNQVKCEATPIENIKSVRKQPINRKKNSSFCCF